MDRIVIIEGPELEDLKRFLEYATQPGVTRLRFTVDGNQVKLKAGGGTWTPGYGALDPECQEAQLQREGAAIRGVQGDTININNWNDRVRHP